jgi:mannose-1-phosphate guanylyltransferase
MGVFPSDHVVGKPAAYRAGSQAALKAAAAGNLVVVGIQPRWPETGYGYIEFPRGTKPGASNRFPCAVSTRSPSWPTPNAIWPPATSTGTPACSSGAPTCCSTSSAATCPNRIRAGFPAPFRIRRFSAALKQAFPLCENISIDYAVLEKAAHVSGIAARDFGWNDVGSWNAVYERCCCPRDAAPLISCKLALVMQVLRTMSS